MRRIILDTDVASLSIKHRRTSPRRRRVSSPGSAPGMSTGTGCSCRCLATARCWLEIAAERYTDLREAVARWSICGWSSCENPHEQPASAYDERTDQWATVYGDGADLIVDAIVHEPQRLIVLRLI
jgi:hypothetical protein